jgi:hypothetical protein
MGLGEGLGLQTIDPAISISKQQRIQHRSFLVLMNWLHETRLRNACSGYQDNPEGLGTSN